MNPTSRPELEILHEHSARLARWLTSLRLPFIAQEKNAVRDEETSAGFYVGVGDQFDDDRCRIHIAE
jgi:hypothetical protein